MSEAGQGLCACLRLPAGLIPATSQAHGKVPQSCPLPYSSSSASDFIWLLENVDYVTAHFQAPAQLQGLSAVWVLPEKTQQLSSCISSCGSTGTPGKTFWL